MSGISSTLRINMGPAMRELCTLEKSCPIPNPSASQQAHGLARYTVSHSSAMSSAVSNSLASRPLMASDYSTLVGRLKEILRKNLAPAIYVDRLIRPFLTKLETQGQGWFASHLAKSEKPIERIAHAILQNFDSASGDIPIETTKAVREVISDMYQVFLHNTCQLGSPAQCLKTASPVPNWYQEGLSTYSHPIESLGANVSIVNVPARYASKSAISWGCLGHEVAGHDILGAFPGALDELKAQLHASFAKANLSETKPYWDLWLEEAAADVLGILNIGPAGALSQIAFFRALGGKEAFKLSSQGYANDTHPIDLVRGYLAAFTVENISTANKRFDKAADYAQLIRAEVDRDAEGVKELTLGTITVSNPEVLELHLEEFCQAQKISLPERPYFCWFSTRPQQLQAWVVAKCDEDVSFARELVNFFEAKKVPQTRRAVLNGQLKEGMESFASHGQLSDFKKSAEIVAKTIMHAKLKALGGKSFHQIKSWTNQDERICNIFQKNLHARAEVIPSPKDLEGFLASHVVAAAVLESVLENGVQKLDGATIQKVFNKMITILQAMHQYNPEWQLFPSAQIAPSQAASSLPSSSIQGAIGSFLSDPRQGKENRIFGVESRRTPHFTPIAVRSSGNSSASSSGMQRKPGLYARNGQ